MMTKIIRQALTAILLLLFSSENVALASIFQKEKEMPVVHHQVLVHHEVQAPFSLLAEENEERDEHDDAFFPIERDILHPHLSPLLSSKNIADGPETHIAFRAVPIYTYHCTFLI